MKIIEPGHVYELNSLDGGTPETLFEKFAELAGIKYKVFDRFNAKIGAS